MAEKRDADGKTKSKLSRKSISLEEKLKVINCFENGERQSDIARKFKLTTSTVRTIILNKDKVKSSVTSATPTSAKRSARTRSPLLEKTERLLINWIDHKRSNDIPLSQEIICAKAVTLFESVKEDEGGDCSETFSASTGWFQNFKRRAGVFSAAISGESASADSTVAATYPDELQAVIESGSFPPQLVFNVDETGLFWKRMPSRSFIFREEKRASGFKALKDRFTLLLGANASGDFKLKPLMIYHSETPRAMKGYSKQHLPVIWMSNKRAWVTQELFLDWYINHFCPSVLTYCNEKGLPPKALLLLDNAPGHPHSLVNTKTPFPVTIMFLPPNTTSILQPMDQGVISVFKAKYLKLTFESLISAIDGDKTESVKSFWKNYNIMSAIEHVKQAWEAVTADCLRGAWGRLWPDAGSSFKGFDDEISDEVHSIAELAREAGMSEVDRENVEELLNHQDSELTYEELKEISSNEDANELEGNQEIEEVKVLTRRVLAEGIDQITAALDSFCDSDPNFERSSTVKRKVLESLSCYKEIIRQMDKSKRQTTLDTYFLASNPVASTSTSK